MEKKKLLKLNLGAACTRIPGFINIDLDDINGLDYKRPIEDLSIFADNSAEYIYASHVIGYFDQEEINGVLTEWKRVLAPGGILRISVCDFSIVTDIYKKYPEKIEDLLQYLYGRELSAGKYIFEKWAYDFESLNTRLKEVGFTDIKRYDPLKTIHKDYFDCSQAHYDPYPNVKIQITLNVECIKAKETVHGN